MDDEEIPHFNSKEEEAKYWKETAIQYRERVEDLERELIDFQENSSQLERELEKSLELADRANRDLRTKCNRMTLDLDMCREKLEQQCLQSSKQISELQKEISEYRDNEEKLIKYIRDLEQKNDDLERAERVMLESVGDIEAKLNSAIERNALLENELDEKETLRTMVQRLKDEQRDMQQELNRQRRQTIPDNDKVMERVRSPIDSNKLSMETQTNPASPMKSKEDQTTPSRSKTFRQSFSCLSNSSRGSYVSIIEYSPTPRRSVSLRKRESSVKAEEKIIFEPNKEKTALKRKPFANIKMHADKTDKKKGQKNEGKENIQYLKKGKTLKFENVSISSFEGNLSKESGNKKNAPFSFLRRKSKKKEKDGIFINNKKK